MRNVLVLVFSDLKHDARVARQVSWLTKRYSVTVVCFDAEAATDARIIRIQQTRLGKWRKAMLALSLLLRMHHLSYRTFHNYGHLEVQLKDKSFDLIIANDIDTLPLAFSLRRKAKIVFDAHEYAPRHFENNRVWKFFFQPFYITLCKRYIHQVDAMMTVGEGLANEYRRNFDVSPVIITNATRYHDLRPSDVKRDSIRLVHHGIANESRKLELMLEMMSYLDERFTLDLMLVTSPYASEKTRDYIRRFTDKIEQTPRVRRVSAVKSSEVVERINQYDLGVFLIPPVNFNYANTLPNKLFDFIQARLGVAIGPTPEMAAIVSRFGNGVVAEDFQPRHLAAKLNQLTADEVARFKQRSVEAAGQLNAEKNEVRFNALLDNLLS